MTTSTDAANEREAIIAFLDWMKLEASEHGQPDAVFWIVQVRRAIQRGDHLSTGQEEENG